MNNLPNWLSSSQNPDEVANKIKGAILVASSLIIMSAAYFFHITLTASDIVTLATQIGAVAGSVWAIYGAILNLITWFSKLAPGSNPVVSGTDVPTA